MDIDFMLTDCTPAQMGPIILALAPVVAKANARFYTRIQGNGNWTLIATDKPEDYDLDPAKGFGSWDKSSETIHTLKTRFILDAKRGVK
jgi:hypothetical protein